MRYIKLFLESYYKPTENWSSPPKEFEKESNLKGISCDWKIPFNKTAEELEQLSNKFMNDERRTSKIFKEVFKLNPELEIFKNYPFMSEKFMYPKCGIIGGVCSCMNVDDIKDYLDNATSILDGPFEGSKKDYEIKRNGKIDKEYSKLYNVVYKKYGHISWFPSIKTMEKILSL